MEKIQKYGRLFRNKKDNEIAYGLTYTISDKETNTIKYVFVVQNRYGQVFDLFEVDYKTNKNGLPYKKDIKSFIKIRDNMIKFYNIEKTYLFNIPFDYNGELIDKKLTPSQGLILSPIALRTGNIPQFEYLDPNLKKQFDFCQVYYSNDKAIARVFFFNKPEKIDIQAVFSKINGQIQYAIAESQPNGDPYEIISGNLDNNIQESIQGLLNKYIPNYLFSTYGNGDNFNNPSIIIEGLSKLPNIWNQ